MNFNEQINQILADYEKQAFIAALAQFLASLVYWGILIFLARLLWVRFRNVETHLKNISDAVRQHPEILKRHAEQFGEHSPTNSPTSKPQVPLTQNPFSSRKPGNIHEAVDVVIYDP